MLKFNFNDVDPKSLAPVLESVWDQFKNKNTMSKKYKLKKWYPALREDMEEGDIVEKVEGFVNLTNGKTRCYVFKEGKAPYYIPTSDVEYPEFWEEFVEKNYEVTCIKRDDGKTFKNKGFLSDGEVVLFDDDHNTYMPENFLGLNRYYIHSVKRLSDNEVFTIGDNIKLKECEPYCGCDIRYTIESFTIKNNSIEISLKDKGEMPLEAAKHAEEPSLTTDDGVDIYEEDRYWIVTNGLYIRPAYGDDGNCLNKRARFSTKEKAEEYVDYHRVKFSEKDVEEALETSTSSCCDDLSDKSEFLKHLYNGS